LSGLIDIAKKEGAFAIISAAYQDPKPAQWLAERTGVRTVVLPFTVGGDARSKDLFGLFDSTIDKLLGAAK
jgi:zinc/manganese transport system substrate-binding protein